MKFMFIYVGALDLPPTSAPALSPAMPRPIADLVFTISAEKVRLPGSLVLPTTTKLNDLVLFASQDKSETRSNPQKLTQ